MIAAISVFEASLWLALCALMVFVSGIFSGAETGLYSINATHLRLAAHAGNSAAVRLQVLMRDRAAFLFMTLFGTNLANYIAPVCLTFVLLGFMEASSRDRAESLAELYTTLILTPIIFVFGEAVPKNVFNRNADQWMTRCSRVLHWAHRACEWSGVISLQRRFSELALRGLTPRTGTAALAPSRFDLYQMLREGAAEGALTTTQASILDRIDRLRSLRVSSIMVPFRQIILLPARATRIEAEPVLRSSRVSRLPVVDASQRKIIGVVHVLDLLTAPPGRTAGDMIRPPVEIAPDTRVLDALTRLQREFRRMAVIVDSKGRCLGIVTVKDLVEEVVGELKAW